MTTLSEEEKRVLANADPTLSPNFVSVLYGDYGKRKTVTACSLVKKKGLLLSSDDSWKVLRNSRHKEVFDRITPITFEGLRQLDYIDYEQGYDTIIWDTFSRSVAKYLDILHKYAKWSGGKGFRQQLEVSSKDIPEFEKPILIENLAPVDYLAARDAFSPILERFFNLPAHIVFTSQMKIPTEGLSKNPQTRPSVPDATFQLVAERADVIGQMEPGANGKFYVNMTENATSMLGKSRIEGLQGKMNLDDFVTKYKEIVFK